MADFVHGNKEVTTRSLENQRVYNENRHFMAPIVTLPLVAPLQLTNVKPCRSLDDTRKTDSHCVFVVTCRDSRSNCSVFPKEKDSYNNQLNTYNHCNRRERGTFAGEKRC